MAECPSCFAALPSTKAKFCPRCGGALPIAKKPHHILPTPIPASARPIRIEKRVSLFNPYVLGSIAIILAGALFAGDGHLVTGSILLTIGLPSLLISTVRSHDR